MTALATDSEPRSIETGGTRLRPRRLPRLCDQGVAARGA
jgi:hypothetical protein